MYKILHSCWLAGGAKDTARFRFALKRPALTQGAILQRLIESNRGCAFAKEHRFDKISTLREFRKNVPIGDGESHRPYFERVAKGESRVLTNESPRFLEPTSGTSGKDKLIPWTPSLINEVSKSVSPWYTDMTRQAPKLCEGAAYFFLSPARDRSTHSEGGLKIGAQDDGDYLDRLSAFVMSKLSALPPAIGKIRDPHLWRIKTMSALIEHPRLGMISAWSPTLLTNLLDGLDECIDELELSKKARKRAEAYLARKRESPFNGLALISCWTRGSAAYDAKKLRQLLPRVPIAPKGLLATEGAVSVAFEKRFPLAITSHFLEFEHVATGEVLLAHQLQEGEHYLPLLTTGGGLWRYRLGDIVCCDGFVHNTPSVQFVRRQGEVSDLAGEKLYAQSVYELIAKHCNEFALICAERKGYVLFSEAGDASLAERFENALLEQHHYRACRKLGQLEALRFVQVQKKSAESLRKHLSGARLGDFKMPAIGDKNAYKHLLARAIS